MISVQELSFSYHHAPILREVSFSVEEGSVLCILGSNGTGKTTLLRCLLGFLQPNNGHITIAEKNATVLNAQNRAHLIAYVPQHSDLAFPFSVQEVVLMGRVSHIALHATYSQHDYELVQQSLKTLGIEHLAHKRFSELSGGQQQMVLVARALTQQARILIMDEPTSALDYHNQICILHAIRELANNNYTICMTSHYPDHAFLAADQVILMKEGRIAYSGAPRDVLIDKNLSDIYETPVTVAHIQTQDQEISTCVPLFSRMKTPSNE